MKFIFPRSLVITLLLICTNALTVQANDPLPSWNNGASKKAIIRFVEKVSTKGGLQFVPPPERIAVFDNDGTLWAEQPLYFQLAFVIDRVKALAQLRISPPTQNL